MLIVLDTLNGLILLASFIQPKGIRMCTCNLPGITTCDCGGSCTCHRSNEKRQYERPKMDINRGIRIAELIQKRFRHKSTNRLLEFITTLAVENERLVTEANAHRQTLGYEQLPTFEPEDVLK